MLYCGLVLELLANCSCCELGVLIVVVGCINEVCVVCLILVI